MLEEVREARALGLLEAGAHAVREVHDDRRDGMIYVKNDAEPVLKRRLREGQELSRGRGRGSHRNRGARHAGVAGAGGPRAERNRRAEPSGESQRADRNHGAAKKKGLHARDRSRNP